MNPETKPPVYPPVFFVRFISWIRSGLINISRKFTHPNVVMLENVEKIWLLGSINVAARLGIADLLSGGPRTIANLARETGMQEDPLYRTMRLLASEGIFKEKNGKVFSNTRISESLCERELKHFILHSLNEMHFRISGEMLHSVRTGRSSMELFINGNAFEHIGASEELNDIYNKAMVNVSRMQVASILSVFKFGRFNHVVDIGGGVGFFLSAILEKNEKLRGTLFDLPHVVNNINNLIDRNNITDRLIIQAGNFLETIPENGDLYTMKNIVHCFNDDDSCRILNNIRKVIPVEGRLLIIEIIIEQNNAPSFGKITDIYMMVGIGGRERTRNEYAILLEKTGFTIEKTIRTVSPHSIIVAKPSLNWFST